LVELGRVGRVFESRCVIVAMRMVVIVFVTVIMFMLFRMRVFMFMRRVLMSV